MVDIRNIRSSSTSTGSQALGQGLFLNAHGQVSTRFKERSNILYSLPLKCPFFKVDTLLIRVRMYTDADKPRIWSLCQVNVSNFHFNWKLQCTWVEQPIVFQVPANKSMRLSWVWFSVGIPTVQGDTGFRLTGVQCPSSVHRKCYHSRKVHTWLKQWIFLVKW